MTAPRHDDLNAFSPSLRRAALARLAGALADGTETAPPAREIMNVHAHTFHSYCSLGLSPSGLVWEAKRRGLAVIGSTDFDVLDALEEMYGAGDALGVKTTVSLEARTFVPAYADREINSPGEPGVLYAMGAGFTAAPGEGTLYPSLLARSRQRNLDMTGRINAVLTAAAIDYDRDVLPLTPGGNATERHLCAAYDAKARELFPGDGERAAFWGRTLSLPQERAAELMGDETALRNAIRATLMKKGGPGYSQPGPDAFPPVEAFFGMIREAGALPCLAWLDGASAGEADPGRLLDDALSWGARCVNVIPDRNWNVPDAAVKARKLAALAAFADAARERRLPILAGTELNAPGQKFVDAFDAPELAPHADAFREGAYFLFGHTVLARLAGMGAGSRWAEKSFGTDREAANEVYARIGRTAGARYADNAPRLSADMPPEAVMRVFQS